VRGVPVLTIFSILPNIRTIRIDESLLTSFYCIHWPFLPQRIGVDASGRRNIRQPKEQVDTVRFYRGRKNDETVDSDVCAGEHAGGQQRLRSAGRVLLRPVRLRQLLRLVLRLRPVQLLLPAAM
jgi:hypothetical protein